jgi:hypothetical protein
MADYEEQTGRTKKVVLEPQITRAWWSKRRAWQGEKVKLFIETRYVPDGSVLKVEVWEDGADEGAPDDFIARIPGTHKVQGNRCEIEYEIKWDQASLGKALKLEGTSYEFAFVASIDKPKLKKQSNLLYVDLHPLLISV